MGKVLGVPGGSLAGATWAASEKIANTGAAGERRTATRLDKLTESGPTVLHDLVFHKGKYTFNIDHAIVYGGKVLLIDSKVWKPGFYWTFRGVTKRGFEPFPYADKKTMELAAAHLTDLGFDVTCSILIVWPSNDSKKLRLGFAKIPGAKAYPPEKALSIIAKIVGHEEANLGTVKRLSRFLSVKS